jgi:hypothetical protein
MPKFVWITSAIHHLPLALHLRKYRGEKEKEKKKNCGIASASTKLQGEKQGNLQKDKKTKVPWEMIRWPDAE